MTDDQQQNDSPGFIPPHGGYEKLNYSSYIENAPPEVAANTMLCLVHQTNYLLEQQLRQLEQAFLKEGGFTERLYQARQQARSVPPRPAFSRANRKPSGPPSNPSNPSDRSYQSNPSNRSYPVPPNQGPASPKPSTPPK
jgi:four helix bundle suffix protein